MRAGWDCHAHLFGPYARYPLAADRSYTPPEAAVTAYDDLLAGLGLAHGVLVHPSAYADDFSLLLDTLAQHPHLRGVLVLRPHTLPSLSGLHAQGIRAARYSHRSGAGGNFAGSASFDDLLTMAPRLADAGLHAELWTDCLALPDLADRLREMPVPVVIDHMGGFDPRAGIDQPGFRSLLSLVESGRVWVKLCAYRNLLTVDDPELGEPFHRALLQAHPGRLLWGSDWPHLRVSPCPATPSLLDLFKRWTADEALVDQVLVHNPTTLYA